jgi:hypothetical protein
MVSQRIDIERKNSIFIQNALAAMSEQIAIRKFANKNDKEIIDSVISTETYP